MRNYHRKTDWAKHSPQASSPIGGVARCHARAARERRREYERRERKGNLAKISNMSSSKGDILHINESKLDSTVRDNEVQIPGFDMSEKIVESPREKGEGGGGGGGRLLNKALFGEALPRGPVSYPYIYYLAKGTPFVYLPLKSSTLFICLLRENKSVREEVFRSFSCNL